MSVVYDQLKRVELTQVKALPPPKGEGEKEEGESLPLEEELKHQKQEKWYSIKSNLVKGGSVLFLLLASLASVVFIASRKGHSPDNQAKSFAVVTPKKVVAKSTTKRFPKETAKPSVVAKRASKVALSGSKASSLRQKQKVRTRKIVKTQITAIKPKELKVQKVNPKMLAKTNKPLPPLQTGQKFYQVGALDQAIQAYKRAIKEDSKQLEAHNNLGVIYTNKGWLKLADKSFHDALRINPYYAEAHYNLAVLLEKTGKKRKALGHYVKFIEYARPKHQKRVKKVKEHVNFN